MRYIVDDQDAVELQSLRGAVLPWLRRDDVAFIDAKIREAQDAHAAPILNTLMRRVGVQLAHPLVGRMHPADEAALCAALASPDLRRDEHPIFVTRSDARLLAYYAGDGEALMQRCHVRLARLAARDRDDFQSLVARMDVEPILRERLGSHRGPQSDGERVLRQLMMRFHRDHIDLPRDSAAAAEAYLCDRVARLESAPEPIEARWPWWRFDYGSWEKTTWDLLAVFMARVVGALEARDAARSIGIYAYATLGFRDPYFARSAVAASPREIIDLASMARAAMFEARAARADEGEAVRMSLGCAEGRPVSEAVSIERARRITGAAGDAVRAWGEVRLRDIREGVGGSVADWDHLVRRLCAGAPEDAGLGVALEDCMGQVLPVTRPALDHWRACYAGTDAFLGWTLLRGWGMVFLAGGIGGAVRGQALALYAGAYLGGLENDRIDAGMWPGIRDTLERDAPGLVDIVAGFVEQPIAHWAYPALVQPSRPIADAALVDLLVTPPCAHPAFVIAPNRSAGMAIAPDAMVASCRECGAHNIDIAPFLALEDGEGRISSLEGYRAMEEVYQSGACIVSPERVNDDAALGWSPFVRRFVGRDVRYGGCPADLGDGIAGALFG